MRYAIVRCAFCFDRETEDTLDEPVVRVEAEQPHDPQMISSNNKAGRIGDLVNRVKPGELRTLFIENLRQSKVGSTENLGCSVWQARVALDGRRKTGVLQEEADVLGEGGFGVVRGARHTIFPGKFAVKRLKQVRVSQVCAMKATSVRRDGCQIYWISGGCGGGEFNHDTREIILRRMCARGCTIAIKAATIFLT